MYESYLAHHKKHNGDTSIERIDNNGNYERSNCKWATRQEQNLNMRKVIRFIGIYNNGYRETGLGQPEFARKHNLDRSCINRCLRGKRKFHKGWSFKFILMEDKN
jgi:hypothetical protein